MSAAVDIHGLTHRYGERTALSNLTLNVARGEIFGLLGPNGSGKTTLFRILCTLLPLQEGVITLFGSDVANSPQEVRRKIGITFQSPSLDGKLTVGENLKHQGHLYGLTGATLKTRIDDLLSRFDLAARRRDAVDDLSGGLKRRVELAKGLLHHPDLLLLDEPTTGLDPTARRDLWDQLRDLQHEGMTILVTTHLMEEAEHCDRIAILDVGKLVAVGSPDDLRRELGEDGLTIHCREPERLAARITEQFGIAPQKIGSALRLELGDRRDIVGELTTRYAADIRSLEFGRPSLEDVFLAKTGHAYDEGEPS